jgi:hypothetical protein
MSLTTTIKKNMDAKTKINLPPMITTLTIASSGY